MTDASKRTKIIDLLNNNEIEDIKDLLFTYLDLYPDDFNTVDMLELIDDLGYIYLRAMVIRDSQALFVANERAGYLKRYLEGRMYQSKDVAEKYVGVQIKNTEAIIKACGRGKEN